ncbi:N-acetyltransferase family protein [Nocardia sp. NPDC003963]
MAPNTDPDESHRTREADKPTVRGAVPTDTGHIVTIRHRVAEEGRWIGAEAPFDITAAARGIRAAIEDGERGVFVAEADDTVIGTAVVEFASPGVTSFAMMLLELHRGRGAGTLLLDQVIGWSREHGAHKVSLQVWPHNEPALALYTRAGFEVEGILRAHYRRRNGDLWDAVVMGLPLPRSAGAHE